MAWSWSWIATSDPRIGALAILYRPFQPRKLSLQPDDPSEMTRISKEACVTQMGGWALLSLEMAGRNLVGKWPEERGFSH